MIRFKRKCGNKKYKEFCPDIDLSNFVSLTGEIRYAFNRPSSPLYNRYDGDVQSMQIKIKPKIEGQ